jgi:hypothetical protein
MCNCKSGKTGKKGKKATEVIEVTNQEPITLIAQEAPEPSSEVIETTTVESGIKVEDIIRAKDFLSGRIFDYSETQWFMSFVNANLGEGLVGYCDVICKKRIRAKLDKLQQELIK